MPTRLTSSRSHEDTPQRESVSAGEKWQDTEMRQSEKCQGSTDEPSSSSSDTCETTVRVDDREPGIISRVASRISSTTNIDPGPAPDGGARAWWSVLGTHLTVMTTWGMMNSFGGFQSHYVQSLSRSPSDIAWIGSIQMFCLFFVGTFAGRLTDAGYFRLVFAAGATMIVFGTLITSACTQYWQFLLAQGLCVGIGNGCTFTPALTVLSTYFKKRQSIAIGLTACGSATGGVIFPSIVRQLLPRVGFAWTMRVIGLIHVVSLTFSLASLKPRIPPRRTGRLVEWTAFRDMEYTYFALGAFLFFWGVFVAFFFIAAFARDTQGFTYTQSLDLLMIMNGVGILGRLVPNYLGDRIGTLTVIIPVVGLGSIVAFCWMAIASSTELYVWAACSGPVLGGIQAMFPSALASLTADPGKQGTRIGMVFTIVSFAVLTGTPIAGALLSAMKGSYLGAQVFSGTSLALGTICVAVAREAKRRREGAPFTAKV